MSRFLIRRLREPGNWRRVLLERLTEPLHLNLLSVFVALFGSFRTKVGFDLVVRQHAAFGLLKAADNARSAGIDRITAIEFGVASGAGLLNMCELGRKVSKLTGVEFDIVGFDSGKGMPPPRDYRDHPEYFSEADYPMLDKQRLLEALPENAWIEFGSFEETVESFLNKHQAPIAFVSVDVDYYYSAVDALQVLKGPSQKYLPTVVMYFDDIRLEGHNPFCGELLAIDEFNSGTEMRKITKYNYIKQNRIFRNAHWIDQMYICHIFDHEDRSKAISKRHGHILSNPYL